MLNKVIFSLLIILITNNAAADTVTDWDNNYFSLISLIETTVDVGDCSISLSKDPQFSENSRILNVLSAGKGLVTFAMFPPKETTGRSQVEFVSKAIIKYRESDMVGWVNLLVYLNKDQSIVGLQLNKSLPNGIVYSQGPTCGIVE